MVKSNNHIPVLLNQMFAAIKIKTNGIYLDCTLGRGGHSKVLLQHIPQGTLYAVDQDQSAITFCQDYFKNYFNIIYIHNNFLNVNKYINQQLDGIIMDLGVSSPQLDNQERGFSYHHNSELDMRMNQQQKLTAQIIVNDYSFEELLKIFNEYGEEKYAFGIAKGIIKARTNKVILTTEELVTIIKTNVPFKYRNQKHPAKKIFQALRIEVNDELNILTKALKVMTKLLKPQGYLAIISFHSLEDRIIKNFFNKVTTFTKTPKEIPLIDIDDSNFIKITKKPLIASEYELQANPRSRSAKLRIIQKKG